MMKDPYWSAIVLAAGQSNRFGGGKLRAVYRQRPVFEWVMRGILSCPVQEVLVVWGAEAGRWCLLKLRHLRLRARA
jgi:CTP:molybdopterin cytidylyltransferase MocA